jgi:hypothetical protein
VNVAPGEQLCIGDPRWWRRGRIRVRKWMGLEWWWVLGLAIQGGLGSRRACVVILQLEFFSFGPLSVVGWTE